jgi:repressor LexA
MKDAGICDGDLIAVRKTGQSQTGRIVVARVGNEVTVKQLRVEKNRIALLPANDAYEPLWVAPDDLIIEGEFVGLIRGGHTLH